MNRNCLSRRSKILVSKLLQGSSTSNGTYPCLQWVSSHHFPQRVHDRFDQSLFGFREYCESPTVNDEEKFLGMNNVNNNNEVTVLRFLRFEFG